MTEPVSIVACILEKRYLTRLAALGAILWVHTISRLPDCTQPKTKVNFFFFELSAGRHQNNLLISLENAAVKRSLSWCRKTETKMFQVVLLDFKYLTFFILDLFQNDRSSPPEVFSGKSVLKICCKFTEHPYRSMISRKLQSIGVKHT